jgi:hypothetical protein
LDFQFWILDFKQGHYLSQLEIAWFSVLRNSQKNQFFSSNPVGAGRAFAPAPEQDNLFFTIP